eukprot:239485-Pelagomonas_calceolata.AAC.1
MQAGKEEGGAQSRKGCDNHTCVFVFEDTYVRRRACSSIYSAPHRRAQQWGHHRLWLLAEHHII